MILDFGQQQNLALALLGDLKGIGTGDAFALRMQNS
jgi:hypothetical protein